METLNQKYAKIFKALCDEQRLHILELLRSGNKCACELLENIDIGQSSLSYHMKILVESGIVEADRMANGLIIRFLSKEVQMQLIS